MRRLGKGGGGERQGRVEGQARVEGGGMGGQRFGFLVCWVHPHPGASSKGKG